MELLGIALNEDCEIVTVVERYSDTSGVVREMLTAEDIDVMLDDDGLDEEDEAALLMASRKMQNVLDEGLVDELQEIEIPEDYDTSEEDEFSFDGDSELGGSDEFASFNEDDELNGDPNGDGLTEFGL